MKKKIIYILMIIAIILGAIMIKTKGFNYSTLYSNHKRLEIVMGNGYDIKDVKKIVDECIKDDPIVRKTTLFGTSVAVDVKSVSDDEINNLFTKLNEKYNKNYSLKELKRDKILSELNATSITSMSDDEITALIAQIKEKYNLEYTSDELKATSASVRITNIPEVSTFDLLKGMIKPMVLSLVIVAVYFGIRFFKLYKKAWIIVPVKFIFSMILTQAFVIAIIAIARIPVSQYIVALLAFVWLLQLISETLKLELSLKKVKAEEEK